MAYPSKLINNDAEQAVLGSLLIDPDAYLKVDFLRSDDFFHINHRWIYEAITALNDRRRPVDFVTLLDELEVRGHLTEVGGSARITNLITVTPTAVNVEHYGRIVQNASSLRRMWDTTGEVAKVINDSETDADATWEKVSTLWSAAEPSREDGEVLLWKDSIEILYEYQFAEQERQRRIEAGELVPIDFPWKAITPYIEILDGGMLMVVAAHTSVGKTSFFENLAEHWARGGLQIAFFHAELSPKKMLHRRTCRLIGTSMSILKRGGGIDDINKATDMVSNWRGGINYVHCPGWTAQRVAGKVRAMHRGRLCDVAIVDYLQKLRLILERSQNPAAGIGQQVEVIKTTGEILDIPTVMGSQFKRAEADREFKTASGIRGSGEVEERANVVLTLDRSILEGPLFINGVPVGKRGDRSPRMECRVDKNTDGDTGNFPLIFKGSRYHILDVNGAQGV